LAALYCAGHLDWAVAVGPEQAGGANFSGDFSCDTPLPWMQFPFGAS